MTYVAAVEGRRPNEYERHPSVPYGHMAHEADKVLCHVCGRPFVHLGAHAWQAHGLDGWNYRREFGLSATTPLTSPRFCERMRTHPKIKAQQITHERRVTDVRLNPQQPTERRLITHRENAAKASQFRWRNRPIERLGEHALTQKLLDAWAAGQDVTLWLERLWATTRPEWPNWPAHRNDEP